MSAASMTPVRVGKWRSLSYWPGFATDPIAMARRLHATHGPFVFLEYPFSTRAKPAVLGAIASADLYRTMLKAPDVWRNVNINFRGPRNHASNRLTVGMTRLRGARHAHYRRLVSGPLKRPSVLSMSPAMAGIADEKVSAWPRGQALNLLPFTETLMKHLAIGLLFGDDTERAIPIADMIALQIQASYPLPSPALYSWFRAATKQEKAILDWAAQKKGELDPRDILSVIANNPDEAGRPPDAAIIGGVLSFTFGAAYETCQNGLIWTLIMLSQHPDIAAALSDEVRSALRGAPPTMDLIDDLPLLDGVMREGLRLFPPVPLTFRRSLSATTLGDAEVAAKVRVLISIFLINRNPDLYIEPERFRPERWSSINPSAFDYATFAAGGHMCPGVTFAHQMMKIALASIMSRFRIEMAPNARIDYRTRITIAPYPAVPVILRDISEAPAANPVAGRIHRLVELPQAA